MVVVVVVILQREKLNINNDINPSFKVRFCSVCSYVCPRIGAKGN